MPVDLAGLPVDRDRLYALARRARAARRRGRRPGVRQHAGRGRRIGAFGDFVSFSFHPNKNITTIEGGCLVAERRARGQAGRAVPPAGGRADRATTGWRSSSSGGKFNLTDVAARVGLGPAAAPGRIQRQAPRARPRATSRCLTPPGSRALGLGLPVADFTDSNWHMFQVHAARGAARPRERADVMAAMHAAGIGTGVALPGGPPFRPLPAAGLEGRRLPERGVRRAQHPDPPALPGDDARPTSPGSSAPCRDPRSAPQAMSAAPELSVVIPVYNEEPNLPAPLRAPLPGARRARARPTRSSSPTTAAPTARFALLQAQHAARPDVTRVIDFNANYGQHMAIMAAFERVRGEVDRDAGRRPPEPARGDPEAARADRRGPRLRRRLPDQPAGQPLPDPGLAADQRRPQPARPRSR